MTAMNLREDFPVLQRNPNLIYFDSASTTLVPLTVIDAITEFLSETGSSSRRGAHALAIKGSSIVENMRKQLAEFTDIKASQISFQKSIASAVASFSLGFDWKGERKDTILVAASEEHSTLVSLQRVSQLLGLEFKTIPISNQGILNLDALEDLVNKSTGIVAVASTTIGWGIKNPLQDIAKIVHDHGALLISDLSRSFGFDIPFLVKSGPDLAITSANTSLMAPPGLAIQWIDEDVGQRHIPGILGGSSVSNVEPTKYDIALQPDKFESDIINIPAIAGLGAAIRYLNHIELSKIESHLKELAIHTLKRMNEIDGLTFFGKPDINSTIFGFNLGDGESISCHDISLFLDESNIATRSGLLCAHPLIKNVSSEGVVQISYSIYNTLNEIDVLFDTLEVIIKDLV